ncbi:universal stress protein [Gandjariella thermophila]|uniref:Universal stress protein n=1 Tax=Gandjariella thermophila TaxID=1931992 RepID=A0A4D4J101_9PSEU|nr:universal stress protein [Gandjariella thermophila]GDY29054.1 universal stress protein [Gandjariella thermophila]
MTLRSVVAPIVVGVDGSAAARHAVRWSAGEAARRDCPLRVVHAHTWPTRRSRARYAAEYGYRRALLSRARRWVDEGVALARGTAPAVRVEGDVRVGSVVELLREESRSARLVVIGAADRGGPAALWEHATAAKLTAQGHCPVVVVRGQPGRAVHRDGPVAVGVDGSLASGAAVGFAFDAAAAHGVPLIAVHSWHRLLADGPLAALPMRQGVEADEEWLLDRQLAVWERRYPGVAVRRVVTRGRLIRSLVERSAGAGLLVLGSRRRGVSGTLLGSVEQAVLHRMPCPVAIVGAGAQG